jgi:uncharacterized LabA/DUF88 family protein
LSDTGDEDKRVIADDVNRLLASFEIDQKEEERILEAFEKFNTQGLILVDGHHVMLEVLNDIDTFNNQIETDRYQRIFSQKNLENIWAKPDPILTANLVGRALMTAVEDEVPYRIAEKIYSGQKFAISRYRALSAISKADPEVHIDPDTHIVVDQHTDVAIFDTDMPDRSPELRKLEKQWEFASRCGDNKKRYNIQKTMDLIKDKRFEFYVEEGTNRILPYDFKSQYLKVLTAEHTYGGAKEKLGYRKTQISNYGNFTSKEKQVDVQLTIAGVDAAHSDKIDWVCLVTNDSDYAPLIERLKKANKDVFLLGFGAPSRQAGLLKEAVGSSNILPKYLLANNDEFSLAQTSPNKKAELSKRSEAFSDWIKQIERNPLFNMLYLDCVLARDGDNDIVGIFDPRELLKGNM